MQETPTLRERNRREAWLAIHTAAAELALEHGPALTTIEMIAGQAGVSRRTFFNYFATKEDAILGVRELEIPAEALAGFREQDGPLLERTVELMAAAVRSATPDQATLDRRAGLIEAMPELHVRLRRITTAAEELLEPIVEGELKSRPREDVDVKALLMLASTILRYAYISHPLEFTAGSGRPVSDSIATFKKVAGVR